MANSPTKVTKTEIEGLGLRESPVFAVVVPVHNQARIIESNLLALIESLTMPFEIVCIDDASTDNSPAQILKALSRAQKSNPNYCRGTLISSSKSLFETRSDVLGISETEAPYILEVQADMHLKDVGFDRRLLRAFERNADIFLISGRGVEPLLPVAQHFIESGGAVNSRGRTPELHLINSIPGSSSALRWVQARRGAEAGLPPNLNASQLVQIAPDISTFLSQGGKAGRLGQTIELPMKLDSDLQSKIWLGETVMRGPLAIRRTAYELLGGLDVNSFFLGFDDHDLALRGWLSAGLRSAYMPIQFTSPLADGSTRQRANWRKIFEIYVLMNRARKSKRFSPLFTLVQAGVNLPPLEIRAVN